MQIGQNMGSWKRTQLALNEISNPYDYFMLNIDLGRLGQDIHGYFESDSIITTDILLRGIEWTNNKSFFH